MSYYHHLYGLGQKNDPCRTLTTDGVCCVFPFVYNGWIYNTCIRKDHTRLWCATTSDYNRDRQWGECAIPNTKTVSTTSTIPSPITQALVKPVKPNSTTLAPVRTSKPQFIGLAVGIPFAVLICSVFCLVLFCWVRNRRKRKDVEGDQEEDSFLKEVKKKITNSPIRRSFNRYVNRENASNVALVGDASVDNSTPLYLEPVVERHNDNSYNKGGDVTGTPKKGAKPEVPSYPILSNPQNRNSSGFDSMAKRKPMPVPRPKLPRVENQYSAIEDLHLDEIIDKNKLEKDNEYYVPSQDDGEAEKPILEAESQYYASADVVRHASPEKSRKPAPPPRPPSLSTSPQIGGGGIRKPIKEAENLYYAAADVLGVISNIPKDCIQPPPDTDDPSPKAMASSCFAAADVLGVVSNIPKDCMQPPPRTSSLNNYLDEPSPNLMASSRFAAADVLGVVSNIPKDCIKTPSTDDPSSKAMAPSSFAAVDVLGVVSNIPKDCIKAPPRTYSLNNNLDDDPSLKVTASSSSARKFEGSPDELTADGQANRKSFAEYVTVEGREAIYKKPSNVVKFDPPEPLNFSKKMYESMRGYREDNNPRLSEYSDVREYAI